MPLRSIIRNWMFGVRIHMQEILLTKLGIDGQTEIYHFSCTYTTKTVRLYGMPLRSIDH